MTPSFHPIFWGISVPKTKSANKTHTRSGSEPGQLTTIVTPSHHFTSSAGTKQTQKGGTSHFLSRFFLLLARSPPSGGVRRLRALYLPAAAAAFGPLGNFPLPHSRNVGGVPRIDIRSLARPLIRSYRYLHFPLSTDLPILLSIQPDFCTPAAPPYILYGHTYISYVPNVAVCVCACKVGVGGRIITIARPSL